MDDLWIEIESSTVFAKSAGERSAPLVLGVHGYSQRNGWHTWEPLIRPLADAGFWAVSVDMPGWGRSVLRQPEKSVSPETVVLLMLNSLGVETAVLMGKSWGGGIVLEVALNHPHRVSKLILTAPARQNVDPLRQLTQPVLLAWAKDDPVIPYEQASRYTAALPNVQLETYSSGGHSAAQNNVNDFAPKAIQFLTRKVP